MTVITMRNGTLEVLKVLVNEDRELRNKELRDKAWILAEDTMKIGFDSWKVYICKILEDLTNQNILERIEYGFRDVRYKFKGEKAKKHAQELLTLNSRSLRELFFKILEEEHKRKPDAEPGPAISYVLWLACELESMLMSVFMSRAALALKSGDKNTIKSNKTQAMVVSAALWDASLQFLTKHSPEIDDLISEQRKALELVSEIYPEEKRAIAYAFEHIGSEETLIELLERKIQRTYENVPKTS